MGRSAGVDRELACKQIANPSDRCCSLLSALTAPQVLLQAQDVGGWPQAMHASGSSLSLCHRALRNSRRWRRRLCRRTTTTKVRHSLRRHVSLRHRLSAGRLAPVRLGLQTVRRTCRTTTSASSGVAAAERRNDQHERLAYSSVGLLDGRMTVSRATPYLGVGWGLTPRAGSRLYFSADLGVMYQRPSAMLTGTAVRPCSVASVRMHTVARRRSRISRGLRTTCACTR